MPDDQGERTADEPPETSLHAYEDGREDEIEEGSSSDELGGATSGGPAEAAGEEDEEGAAEERE